MRRPTQAQARQNGSMETRDSQEVPPLSKMTLATDSCREKKSQSLQGVLIKASATLVLLPEDRKMKELHGSDQTSSGSGKNSR